MSTEEAKQGNRLAPIRSHRADGRFTSTAGWVHHRLKTLRPALAFDPRMTADEFLAWKREVRRRLTRLLALPRVSLEPPPKLISDEPRDGYSLQRWELYPEPDSVLPVLLLVPDCASRSHRAPGVLCLPGTDHPNEWLAGEPDVPGTPPRRFVTQNAMALHLVRCGMVALCVENPGTASLAEPRVSDWRRQSWELVWLGTSYEALSVFHKRVALRWLRTLPMVDRRRLAACGHSLGGKPSVLLGVLEPSLRAVVWNSGAYDWRLRHVVTNLKPVAPWHYIPGFIRWFDYLDLKAALAPMPLLLSEGGRAEGLEKVRQAYALAGAPDALTVSYVPSFRDASRRTRDGEPMPEGLEQEEFLLYQNGTNDEHYFKDDVTVPWLCRALGLGRPAP